MASKFDVNSGKAREALHDRRPSADVQHYAISYNHIQLAAQSLAAQIRTEYGRCATIYGIPRGGVCAAYAVMAYSMDSFDMVNKIEYAQVVIDDLVDTGKTREDYRVRYSGKTFAVLFDKSPPGRDYLVGLPLPPDTGWLDFPWEMNDVR